jgi:PPIC-type PPIASE domain
MIRALLREPLLHFLLIGLLLFLAYARLNPGSGDANEIVVDQARIQEIARQFESTWSRTPQASELQGLIDTYVEDEILYREGVALGLDEDDLVIRRRIRQKLEVISEELSGDKAPTEAELMAWLQAHTDDYRQPPLVTFEQVYFGPQGPDAPQAQRIESARAALNGGADPARHGQPTLLPRSGTQQALDLVARSFGQEFAAQLETLPVGGWQGPVASAFGMHLVRISAREPARLPDLAQVRQAVERDWEAARRRSAFAENYRRLRAQYDVQVHMPTAATP